MKKCCFAAAALLLVGHQSAGQSLADVLSSVQERKLLLEQAQAVMREHTTLPSGYGYPGGDSGTFELITWTNCPESFPSEANLSSLGIEDRVRLLNEARRHFQTIRAGFVNVAPERLNDSSGLRPPAVIRRFGELSLSTPPVANHQNYLGVLRELACKVDALRVTPWPVDYTLTTGTIDNGSGVAPQSSGADKIKWSEINQSSSTGSNYFWAHEWPAWVSFKVDGENYEWNVGTPENPDWQSREFRKAQRRWVSDFSLSFAPTSLSLPSGVSAVEGTCVVLAEQLNNPYLGAAGTGTNAEAIPRKGGYEILVSATSEGNQSISSPQWVVSGQWVTSGNPDTDQKRYEKVFKPDLGTARKYDTMFSSGSSYKYTCIEQNIVFMMVPSFSKGLDAVEEGEDPVDYAWDRPRSPGTPGALGVSGGSAKLALNAGRGDAMFVGGSVQIQHGWTAYPGIWGGMAPFPSALPELLWGHPNESIGHLDYFTDGVNHRRLPLSFGSNLRFAGPERDYEVIYETRFDQGRATLEDWPESSVGVAGDNQWQHGMVYYWEWQKPRLKQVLGREALIDIAPGADDYTHTINVYRIPTGHTISYDSDGFVVTTGLAELKTVTVDGASRNQNGFPTDDLFLSVNADGGEWSVQGGTGTDWMSYPVEWDVVLKKAGTSTVLHEEEWASTVDYTTEDPLNMSLIGYEAPIMESVELVVTMDGEATTETTSTFTTVSLRSLVADPLPRVSNISQASGVGTVTTVFTPETGANAPDFPTTITVNAPNEPQVTTKLSTSGVPDYVERGSGGTQWKTDWSTVSNDGRLLAEHSFGGAVYARDWTKWEDGGWTVTTFTAPDGSETDPDGTAVDWSKMEIGRIGGNGFVGLPHLLTQRDGSGATWDWTIGADGSASLDLRQGKIESGSVTRGSKLIASTNPRGYTTGAEHFLIQSSGTLKVAGFSVPTGKFSSWGAPTESEDYTSGLSEQWSYDNNRERIASVTDGFDVITTYSDFDALDRPGSFTWKGHQGGSLSYNVSGFDSSSSISIGGRTVASSSSWDALGRATAGSVTAGGNRSFTLSHGSGSKTLETSDSVTGATHTVKTRTTDGTTEDAYGTSLAFGGIDGTVLAVDDGASDPAMEGLLRSTVSNDELASSFRTTWTDAWGRTRKVAVTGTDGANDDETTFFFNGPDSEIKTVEVHHASGRRTIRETKPWATGGIITSSGLDKDKDGELDAGDGDRFVTSTTAVAGSVIRTTVTQTGNATNLMVRDYNPATGAETIYLNGDSSSHEERIVVTPNYPEKTVNTKRYRDGTAISDETVALNHLGQPDGTTASGPGMATTSLNPVFRDDGSLESFEFEVAGETWALGFDAEGKIDTYSRPDPDNPGESESVSVNHTINAGVETLMVDNTTVVRALDGTSSSLSGEAVMDRSRATTLKSGHIVDTIDPGAGEDTAIVHNASGVKTGHDYVADPNATYPTASDRQSSYLPGRLLHTVSRQRSGVGDVVLGYTNDGARDLQSITIPSASSAGFIDTFYGHTITLDRDDAGKINDIKDRSGHRDRNHEKNRLTTTDWLSGELDDYKIVRAYDTLGRLDLVTVWRDGAAVHSWDPVYTGSSDEFDGVTSGTFTADYTRNAGRHLTAVTRGSVIQNWGRGVAGRITSAGTAGVTGAPPSFTYSNFDPKGRRKSVVTNRGTWFYDYRGGNNGDGQLAGASNGTLNASFTYTFDGIGRRKDFDADPQIDNGNDPLNQFGGMTHPQVAKNLYISADPDARIWVNGTEINPAPDDFDGFEAVPLAHPGSAGGWVAWTVKGVLAGAGDSNPAANPDAEAEFGGNVWFPPATENFTFDADGNRESSALWDFGWDGRNRLVRARTKDYATADEGWYLEFDYDAEGRRFKKEVTRYADGQVIDHKVIYFIWDGWDLVFERHEDANGNGLLERKYVWGAAISSSPGGAGGAGGLLLMRETHRQAQPKDYYPIYDGTGHVVGLVDENDHLVAEYWWGPFGEMIEAKGEMAQANPWRYATKYFDHETGLYYFGLRYYDPVTGQWLSREPLGESESLNLYSYCHNDPVNSVDVLGLHEWNMSGIFRWPFGKKAKRRGPTIGQLRLQRERAAIHAMDHGLPPVDMAVLPHEVRARTTFQKAVAGASGALFPLRDERQLALAPTVPTGSGAAHRAKLYGKTFALNLFQLSDLVNCRQSYTTGLLRDDIYSNYTIAEADTAQLNLFFVEIAGPGVARRAGQGAMKGMQSLMGRWSGRMPALRSWTTSRPPALPHISVSDLELKELLDVAESAWFPRITRLQKSSVPLAMGMRRGRLPIPAQGRIHLQDSDAVMGIVRDGKVVGIGDPLVLSHADLAEDLGLKILPGHALPSGYEGFIVQKLQGTVGMTGSSFNETLSSTAQTALQVLFK